MVKADGLAAGKGVIVCSTTEEALEAVDRIMVREEFGRDVVIDIVCFRKLGHNEQDEPAVTQPLIHWINRPTFQQALQFQSGR